jgi:hypothetical protein
MTKGTRYFLTGAALILSLGLGTGLVAYYKGDLQLFRSQIGPEELSYVPTAVSGLAYADVREIMNSEFRQKLREVLPTGEGKDKFLNETGIDIERDIQSVVAAAGVGGDPTAHPLVLIRGMFDEPRIELLIKQHNGTVEMYKGKRLMMPRATNDVRPNGFCLTFPETGLALLGSEAHVRAALDAHESGNNVADNAPLMKLVSNFHGTGGNTAWAVGNLEAVTNNPNVPQQVRDQLPGIEWVAISAHVNSGLSGRFLAQAKDDKAATDLRAVVNGALAAGRLVGGNNPQFEPFLNSLQAGGGGKEVELSFNLSPEMLDVLTQMAGQKRPTTAPQQLN